jgi:hypothetical protein
VPVLGSSLTSLQNLATVDLYRYDEAWELEPAKASSQLTDTITHHVNTVVFDLRKPEDFITSHIPGSYNIPAAEFERFDSQSVFRRSNTGEIVLTHTNS